VLRRDAISAFRDAVKEDEENELLQLREKTRDEAEQEEDEYRAFLEREVGADLRGLISLDDGVAEPKAAPEPEGEPESKEERKKRKKEEKKKEKKKAAQAGTGVKSKEDEDRDFLIKSLLFFALGSIS
jgi:protein KRI1